MRLLVALLAACAATWGADAAEIRAAAFLEKIRQEPPRVRAFLQDMPKGADLHDHLEGSVYAETFIALAAQDGLCAGRKDFMITDPPCALGQFPVKDALGDTALYAEMIDSLSMRNWAPGRDSGADHFFFAFPKFARVARAHVPEMLAEVVSRAAGGHLQYVEVLYAADRGAAAQLGSAVGWDDDFGKLRERLLDGGVRDVVRATREFMDGVESGLRKQMKCGTPEAGAGCDVVLRHLFQALRGFAPQQVFTQLLVGFELCSADGRWVGINMVMPEHWYVPVRDFDLHMKMLDYLRRQYPKVRITLHAGELGFGQVPPEVLRYHIRDSIEKGGAERIGHGTDILYERDAEKLLDEMAKRRVLVEISPSSSDWILGIRGASHPLPVYLKRGIPVALATDDQGVSRSDITGEFVRAFLGFGLSYRQLKQMARESLEHSFLPGDSLWTDKGLAARTPACATLGSAACRKFLEGSERARVQVRLEAELVKFEGRF